MAETPGLQSLQFVRLVNADTITHIQCDLMPVMTLLPQ